MELAVLLGLIPAGREAVGLYMRLALDEGVSLRVGEGAYAPSV